MAIGDTNLTNLVLSGDLTVGGELSIGSQITIEGSGFVTVSETVGYGDFTDNEDATGTYEFQSDIPVGAFVICARISAVTGFTGDTSAVITIGDGSDADRYNTGTPSVFTTAANGVSAGAPSGTQYHVSAATPTLIVTSDSDFTDVEAGEVTIDITYLV